MVSDWNSFFMWLIFVVLPKLALAYLAAHHARKKGYSFRAFLIVGFFFSIPTLIIVLAILPYKVSSKESDVTISSK